MLLQTPLVQSMPVKFFSLCIFNLFSIWLAACNVAVVGHQSSHVEYEVQLALALVMTTSLTVETELTLAGELAGHVFTPHFSPHYVGICDSKHSSPLVPHYYWPADCVCDVNTLKWSLQSPGPVVDILVIPELRGEQRGTGGTLNSEH